MSDNHSTSQIVSNQESPIPFGLLIVKYLSTNKKIVEVLISDFKKIGYEEKEIENFIRSTNGVEFKTISGNEYVLITNEFKKEVESNKKIIDTFKIHSSKNIKKTIPKSDLIIDTSKINKEKDGWIYLLKNDELGILKIGYSFYIHNRMKVHSNNGFRSIEVLKINENRAFVVEQFLLSFVRCNWVPFGKEIFSHEFDGSSECWLEKDYPIYSFDQLRGYIIDYAVNCLPEGIEEIVQ